MFSLQIFIGYDRDVPNRYSIHHESLLLLEI